MSSRRRKSTQRAQETQDDDDEFNEHNDDHDDDDYDDEEESEGQHRPKTSRKRPRRSQEGGPSNQNQQNAQRQPQQTQHEEGLGLDEDDDDAGGNGQRARRGRAQGAEVEKLFPKEEMQKIKVRHDKYKQAAHDAQIETHLDLPQHELDALVGKVIRLMIFHQYDKPGQPVPRARVVDAITSDHKTHAKVKSFAKVIVPVAQYRLYKVMGLEMVEMEKGASGGEQAGRGGDVSGAKSYVLRSVLPYEARKRVVGDPAPMKGPSRGLVMLVLALIYMSGGKIPPDALEEWLRQCGVDMKHDDKPHSQLNKIKDQFTKMEQCRYIEKIKPRAGGGGASAAMTYQWGEAASTEIGVAGIKEYIQEEMQILSGGRNRQAGRGAVEAVDLVDSDE